MTSSTVITAGAPRRSTASATATSRDVSTCRPSPADRSTRGSSAPSAAVAPSASRPRSASTRRASRSSGSRRKRVDRLRSGGLTSKNGFSVVAPMSVMSPSSTLGSSASCCALLKRWISSRKRIVRWSRSPSRARARSMISRTSLTDADTAESCSKARLVVAATTWASVVFPVPGGPQKMAEESRSASTSARSGRPGPTSSSWPTISSSVRGRRRAASGDCRRRRSSTAALNRSSGNGGTVPPVTTLGANRPYRTRFVRNGPSRQDESRYYRAPDSAPGGRNRACPLAPAPLRWPGPSSWPRSPWPLPASPAAARGQVAGGRHPEAERKEYVVLATDEARWPRPRRRSSPPAAR